jgi:hypothetical protein
MIRDLLTFIYFGSGWTLFFLAALIAAPVVIYVRNRAEAKRLAAERPPPTLREL